MLKRALLGLTIAALSVTAQAGTFHETVDRTFDARPGMAFSLTNVNGHITIRSWDQPRIRVHAEKTAEAFDNDAAKKGLAELKIEMAQTGDRLNVVTHCPRNNTFNIFDFLSGQQVGLSVAYEITLPRQINVNVDNTNGAIELSGVSGNLKLETTNGRITADPASGRLEAHSTNGSIHARLLRVDGDRPLNIETTNGRIEITVPPALRATLDARTTNGSVRSDLPVTVAAHSGGGRTSLQGTINGGGPELILRTTNGSIAIKSGA
ncbi:MAG TPA: DUF4097 family beta strand repeat-containing protein [Thermoanaerobaculia bacterium]|nr:DUF4097 family beta strand repeat-containing protein [Thermoanaerobaculia bacterium]